MAYPFLVFTDYSLSVIVSNLGMDSKENDPYQVNQPHPISSYFIQEENPYFDLMCIAWDGTQVHIQKNRK